MLYSTKGIVLRLVQYKDNSYIAEIYTQKFGKVSFSVHRPQSKKATIRSYHLMPFSLLEMSIKRIEIFKKYVKLVLQQSFMGWWKALLKG